jgi:two-component system sensor histidine kinase/response regulator
MMGADQAAREEVAAMDTDDALHRALVDASTDGLWIFDETGTTTWANARMAELLGVDPDRMAGFRVEDALDREGRRQLPDHLAAMATSEVGQDNVESKFVRADGTEIWTLVSWSPLRDDDGRRAGWLHRVTEYTDRRALLDTLRDREQQLATAQSIARIGSWSWDVPTNTVTWSDQLYRIYNLEPDEHDATYEGFLDRIHPEDRDRVREIVGSTFAGADDFAFDSRIIRRGGEVRWIRGLGRVERADDGTPLAMGGTTQDITDLKRADLLAAEATRRLELLQGMAMAANQATSLVEAIATMAVALPRFTTWTAVGVYTVGVDGMMAREPLHSSGTDWEPLPDPALAERARLSRRVETGPPSVHADTHSLVAIPVLLAARAVAVIEVLADEVPPDENSMFLISQIAGQLSLVAERERSAQELAEARDEAMEASRLKSEFLATMSHEIRTPMNGVIGLNELLLDTELDDHQRRLAEGLQRAGLTLLGIINDILDLSKIESGKLELEAVDFDVRSVFEQSASVLSGPAHTKGLELVVACHPDVPLFLRGDSVRFGQVLTNLGSNAVKFTDHGEVVVSARVERESEDEVVLRVDVVDSGVGIAPGARATLFDAFTQADPSTTRRHGGTGLGLAISRQLVEALGGEITVSSEVGRGSTFSFTAAFGRAGGAAGRRSASSQGLQGRRVLVVDDNETNRLILTEQLAAWQMDVAAASSATEAMTALRDAVAEGWPFEVVLLDLVMPDTDGLELARLIGAEPGLGGPVMLLLSSNQGVRPQAARDAGVLASLEKPVRHSELHDALVGVTDLAGPSVQPSTAQRSPRAPLGLHVLVVEDNQVNQLVATGLLENLGFEVEVAPDGAEAVDRLTTDHDFAAVLMDCRMPLLDGFDATRAVRAAESGGRRVPIIAMTASALEGERERCLAAGMDDFLTKPVDAADLERVIRRWALDRPTGRDTPATPPEPPAAPVLDEARVQMLEELKKDGVSFFERTATSFLSRVDGQVRAIRDAVDSGDAAALQGSAHQLKGSALNLGLPLVAAAAARLEALGDAASTTGTAPLLDELSAEVERAIAALREATARSR